MKIKNKKSDKQAVCSVFGLLIGFILVRVVKKSLYDILLKIQYIDFISKKVNIVYLKIMKITVNLSKSIRTPIQITTHFQILYTGGSAL